MAELLLWLAGGINLLLMLYSAYQGIVFCGYFRRRKAVPAAPPAVRFAVVVAARNEEAVIGDLIDSFQRQTYPKEYFDVIVIPNNCSDATEQCARAHGARILPCTVPVKSKGEVLSFAFSELLSEDYDAFCIFDADNVADEDYLEAMNRAFAAGVKIAQGYRESKNPGSTWVSAGYSIYFRMIGECINRPRASWGLPVFLGGTGWAVHKSCLEKYGWETSSIVEDCEYTLSCVLRGEKIAWVRDAVTYDEQPVSFRQSFTQRRRWSSGMLRLLPRYISQLRKNSGGSLLKRMDALISVASPLMQVFSYVPALLTTAACLLSGRAELLAAGVLLPFILNLLGTTAGAAGVCFIGQGYKKGLWKGALTYWLFTLSWVWINFISLFKKIEIWKEIQHTVSWKNDVEKTMEPVI